MNDDYSAPPEEAEGGIAGMLNHLPAILWQRRWLIIIPFVVLSIAGVAAAFLLPTTYRSSAVLLVESQELPPDLVGSPVTALIDQRIAKIRQQVLSRGDLINLIQQYNLYPNDRREKPLSEIVDKMRENTIVEALSADIGQRQGPANTIAFSMSFDYREAAQAQLVMQSYVERFLELDATQMAEQAGNTVQFLTDQANSIQQQIATIEGRITQIKTANGAILAQAGMATISNPGSYDSQIAALQRENMLLTQQVRTQSAQKDPVVQQAESNLAAVRAVYTDDHPDVRAAERQLEAAKSVAESRLASGTGGTDVASAAISANNAQIAALGQARAAEASRSSSSLSAQARAPVVMEQIAQLESRAEALRSQFRDVSGRLLNARSSARMETEQKGERLSVVDPASMPDEPLSPNRELLAAAGVLGGLAGGVLLAILAEILLRPIRGVAEIERLLGVPPLVVIPTMRGDGEPAPKGVLGKIGRFFTAPFRKVGQLLSFRRSPRPAQ